MAQLIDIARSRRTSPLAAVPPVPAARPLTVIQPPTGWQALDLGELWRYRELLFFLTWRDVKVRYKQTALGAAWAVLQPLMTMIVFSLFFGRLAGVPSGGLPYPLFVFAGLLPWTFFANAISGAGQSVVGSESLITKVYFPRLIIPIAAVGAGLVDFADRLRHARRADGLLRGRSRAGDPPGPAARRRAGPRGGGRRVAAGGPERGLPRLPLRRSRSWSSSGCSPPRPSTCSPRPDARPRPGGAFLPLNPAYGLIANFRAAVLGGPLDPYALSVSLAVSPWSCSWPARSTSAASSAASPTSSES